MPRAENLHSDEEDEQSLRYLISPLLVQRGNERKGVSELMDTHVRWEGVSSCVHVGSHCVVIFGDRCLAVPSSLEGCVELEQNHRISVEWRTLIRVGETTGVSELSGVGGVVDASAWRGLKIADYWSQIYMGLICRVLVFWVDLTEVVKPEGCYVESKRDTWYATMSATLLSTAYRMHGPESNHTVI